MYHFQKADFPILDEYINNLINNFISSLKKLNYEINSLKELIIKEKEEFLDLF